MPTVSNATPLIYLGKVGKLYFLKELYGEVFLASDIWEDLIKPLVLAKPIPEDLPYILEAMREGWLKIKDIKTPEALILRDELLAMGFGKGEASSIALAKELGLLFLANDKEAIDAAKERAIDVRWFTEILHEAMTKGLIKDSEEYTQVLDGCRNKGLYISKKEREVAVNKAREIERKKRLT